MCCSALFMTLLDVSITNVALPSISDSTGAGPSQLQWIVSGYTLSFGLVPVLAGRLGDDHGRRLMFQVGVAGFAVTSAISGLAPTAELLIAARVFQGIFGGLINPQVSGLIQQMFRGEERGRAFGALGTTVGLGTALGPLAGGALIALGGPDLGWRLVFFVNVPVGIAVILLGRRYLPRTPAGRAAPARRDRVRSPWVRRRSACCSRAVEYELLGRSVVLLAVPAAAAAVPVLPTGAAADPRRAGPAGRPAAVPPPVLHLRDRAGPALLPRDGRAAARPGALLPARAGLQRPRTPHSA